MKSAQKFLTILVGGLLVSFLPVTALAQSNSYPVSSRALFLAGCLQDEPGLNLQDEDKVYYRMQICVCILDQFQRAYTNTEFTTLFEGVANNNSAAQQELEQFLSKQNYSSCR